MKTKGTPNTIDKQVGINLKQRRKLMGITQAQLATQAGVTFQQIQKYENGTNRISCGRIKTFSQILDVPVGYFFDEEPYIPEHFSGRQIQAIAKLSQHPIKTQNAFFKDA